MASLWFTVLAAGPRREAETPITPDPGRHACLTLGLATAATLGKQRLMTSAGPRWGW